MLRKEEFIAWKHGNVTQEMEAVLRDMIGTLAGEIVTREVPNTDRDMFVRGVIKGLIAISEWEPEFAPEDEEEK